MATYGTDVLAILVEQLEKKRQANKDLELDRMKWKYQEEQDRFDRERRQEEFDWRKEQADRDRMMSNRQEKRTRLEEIRFGKEANERQAFGVDIDKAQRSGGGVSQHEYDYLIENYGQNIEIMNALRGVEINPDATDYAFGAEDYIPTDKPDQEGESFFDKWFGGEEKTKTPGEMFQDDVYKDYKTETKTKPWTTDLEGGTFGERLIENIKGKLTPSDNIPVGENIPFGQGTEEFPIPMPDGDYEEQTEFFGQRPTKDIGVGNLKATDAPQYKSSDLMDNTYNDEKLKMPKKVKRRGKVGVGAYKTDDEQKKYERDSWDKNKNAEYNMIKLFNR